MIEAEVCGKDPTDRGSTCSSLKDDTLLRINVVSVDGDSRLTQQKLQRSMPF